VESGGHKSCKISETVQDRTKYYYGLIGSQIPASDSHQREWPWMSMNGRSVPLAEMNKSSGACQNNFNEDRLILFAENVACDPNFSKYKRCADIYITYSYKSTEITHRRTRTWLQSYMVNIMSVVTEQGSWQRVYGKPLLQHVSIACYAEHCTSYSKSVHPSVCLSICHTLVSCQSDSSYNHAVFTGG